MSTVTNTPDTLPAGTWKVDPTHSQVGFAVPYMGGTFRGTFSPVEATLEVSESGEARLEGSAPAAAIHVQDENLTNHLLSPDFFDAERAPELRFRSNEIRRSGSEVTVRGELGIKGVTAPVELRGTIAGQLTDPYGNERIGLTLHGTVDRTTFGLNWNNPLPSGEPALADDVELNAELYLVKG